MKKFITGETPQRKTSFLGLAMLLCVALMAVAATASAEIRSGTRTDPSGDSLGSPSQDIVGVSATLDSNGQARVTATMNGPIASGPASFFSFSMSSFVPPSSCSGVSLSMFGFSDSTEPLFMVTGYKGLGSGFGSVYANSITFSASNAALQSKDWSCVTASVTPKGGGGTVLDQLDAPLFFVGFGPDTDGDGIKDSSDTCPTEAGSGSTGCPAPVARNTVAGSKCKAPKLTGKTLKQARRAIVAAHCKLGKVKKPKHPPNAAHLVVRSSKVHGSAIDITLAPRKH